MLWCRGYLRGDCHDVTIFLFYRYKDICEEIHNLDDENLYSIVPSAVQSESFESEGVPDAPAAPGETSVALPAPDVVSAHYFSENSTKP